MTSLRAWYRALPTASRDRVHLAILALSIIAAPVALALAWHDPSARWVVAGCAPFAVWALAAVLLLDGGPPPAQPIDITDTGVRRVLPEGVEEVRWADVAEVWIVTTSEGPAVEDVYWLLLETQGRGCAVPNASAQALFPHLSRLPGFGVEAFAVIARAMGSTADTRFLCWRREGSPPILDAQKGPSQ